MNNVTVQRSKDTDLLTILGLIFITLKLTGYIAWGWWWVLAPFWVPLAFLAIFALIAAIVFSVKVR